MRNSYNTMDWPTTHNDIDINTHQYSDIINVPLHITNSLNMTGIVWTQNHWPYANSSDPMVYLWLAPLPVITTNLLMHSWPFHKGQRGIHINFYIIICGVNFWHSSIPLPYNWLLTPPPQCGWAVSTLQVTTIYHCSLNITR